MLDHGNGHDADRPCPCDEHIFAEHGKGKTRVNRISKRIEDGSHFLIDLWVMAPDVCHGQ
jgi:hypothetical protein